MSLRVRLAITFAFVALITAAAVALAAPSIVGRGFAQLEAGDTGGSGPGSGQGQGAGQGHGGGLGPGAGVHAQQVQRDTSVTLIAVALAAAAGASLVGYVLAGRIAGPLGRLGAAAAAVAQGDLRRRSGLAARTDEIGSLGRSFDVMAAELEAAETSRRRFFQDAVHELKTPLAVIEATTTAVLDGVYAHDDRHLQTIRAQSRLLTRIVDDLRTIGLAEAGHLPLRLEPLAIDRLSDEIVRSFEPRAEAEGLRLELDVAPGLTVMADTDRLRQILGALLDNAIRHTPAGGSVLVEAAPVSGFVRVAVRDTGPGIAADDLPRVFDRFYQADPGRDRSTGTTGLGLTIVRALVEAHGGSVGAENVPGGGARIWVELRAPATPA